MTLGTFVRERRLALDLSLRRFAEMMKMDPSHWSKIERGRLPFSEEDEKLELLAKLLNIKKDSSEWFELKSLVAVSRKQIPAEVYSDKEVLSALPIFFRTASGSRPTQEELDKIIHILKDR